MAIWVKFPLGKVRSYNVSYECLLATLWYYEHSYWNPVDRFPSESQSSFFFLKKRKGFNCKSKEIFQVLFLTIDKTKYETRSALWP